MSSSAQPPPAGFDPASLVGTTLDGLYRIDQHLASGGMGAVFRAHHVFLRKDVALKVLRPELTASPELQERFRRESEIAASLEHRHIVRVTDFRRTSDGLLYLAMELLNGESLFDRLRREGFLPPEEAVQILWQLCDGLEAAHEKGVVHRDLKPENVFLARGPGGEVVKILDFGIAKMADPTSSTATQAGMVVGTPEYLSPEQATGSPVDARADLYTVGIIAWRMLAGHHPFKADDPRSLLMMQATKPVPLLTEARADLSAFPLLVAAVTRACEKDPLARYQSAAEFKADLGTVLDHGLGLPAIATPPPAVSYTSLSPVPSSTFERTLSPLPSPSGTIRLGAHVEPQPPLPAAPGEPVQVAPSWLRRHPRLAIGAAAAASIVIAGALLLAWQARPGLSPDRAAALAAAATEAERTAARARAEAEAEQARVTAEAASSEERARPLRKAELALATGKPAEARALLAPLLATRAGEAHVHELMGRAWHDEGERVRALDAWTTALALGPLERPTLDRLVTDLSRDRAVADRAARLLVQAGAVSGPSLATLFPKAPASVRLRALALARELGPSSGVDVLGGYLGLVGDADCEVRKQAARALGELKDRRALDKLYMRANAKDVRTIGSIIISSKPSCGAIEAGDAIRRIEGR